MQGTWILNVSVSELREYINWDFFFMLWQLKGRYPAICDNPDYGAEARKLWSDAQTMLDRMENYVRPVAVFGIYPANAIGDDIVVLGKVVGECPSQERTVGEYSSQERTVGEYPLQERTVGEYPPPLWGGAGGEVIFHNLRNQIDNKSAPNICLSDFIAPNDSGLNDWLGAFVVTAGHGLEKLLQEFDAADDYSAIMAKALADRLAEAFAEYIHMEIRTKYWGYAKDENLSINDLLNGNYTGIRPAPGYPTSPDHSEKKKLFALLDAENNIDVSLTESFMIQPVASVCALVFAHPQSKYFRVDKIARDQLEDYALRKKISVEQAEYNVKMNLV
jgi:5-methyltetrahydrofolate--homocysteine methyltransferase